MINVRHIMTRGVIRVSPKTTLADAITIIQRNDVTGAPVVEDNIVVGILSLADLLKACGELGTDALSNHTVDAFMSSDVLAVTADATIHEASAAMVRHKIHRLAVVQPDGRLDGIVSTLDCLAYFTGQKRV